jgi:hypothetical protein
MPGLQQVRSERRRLHLPAGPLLAMLVSALLLVGLPQAASAADPPVPSYLVEICTDRSQEGTDLIAGAEGEPGPIEYKTCEIGPPTSVHLRSPGGTVAPTGGRSWTLVAPPGTAIHTLSLERALSQPTSSESFLEWELASWRGQLDRFLNAGSPLPAPKNLTYPVDSPVVRSRLFCPFLREPGCPGGEFDVTLSSISVEMDDFESPTLFGPIVPAGPLRGVAQVGYGATSGPGVASASLIVDGKEQPAVRDTNGGECEEPYRLLSPCETNVSASLALDTTKLSEGQHEVRVAVADAARSRTVSSPVTFTVRNLPTATGRPIVGGSPQVGKQLTATTGAWEGNPTSFGFQWLRCPATTTKAGETTGCTAIAGATGQRYTAAAGDVGQRELVRVTATNPTGSVSEVSAASEVITPAPAPGPGPSPGPGPGRHRQGPKLSHVTLSRKRFHVTKPPAKVRGTVLAFSSSKPGRLTIVISPMPRGKKRPKALAKLAADVKAGRSSVRLSGEIGRGRFLKPGRYQVTITVRDAKGDVSEPASRPFTVLPG